MSEPESLGAVLARTMLRQMSVPIGDADGPGSYCWTDAECARVRRLLRHHLHELEALDRWQHLCPELRAT